MSSGLDVTVFVSSLELHRNFQFRAYGSDNFENRQSLHQNYHHLKEDWFIIMNLLSNGVNSYILTPEIHIFSSAKQIEFYFKVLDRALKYILH